MAKKYDLIVVGGGPGGLMAARTAAEDGLKVLLIERKRNITEINRACTRSFFTHLLSLAPGVDSELGQPYHDGYIDPVSVEVGPEKTRFHFPVPGFSIDYTGPLRPYINWVSISPSGHQILGYKLNDRPWGFYIEKETFVAQLLTLAEKAGVEVWSEATGLAAENTGDGVQVRVSRKAGEETLEARAAIAADGLQSRIVESLGINQTRQGLGSVQYAYLQYVMEGIETDLPQSAWLTWSIPSLNPWAFPGIGAACITQWADNMNILGTLALGRISPEMVLDKFMKHPRWSGMFRHARIVKKEGMGMSGKMLGPVKEPVAGNVVIIGDAGAPVESWIQGAVASGYMAAKSIKRELNGQKGYPDYMGWWQKAFFFNDPDYLKTVGSAFSRPLSKICTDEEMDFIYELFQGRLGIPEMMVARNLKLIQSKRPELYEKLTRG